jgi:hypothetical protein
MRDYPHWRRSEEQSIKLRQKITELLVKSGLNTDKVLGLVNKIINHLRGSTDG